jgi:hypothetical protein
VTLRHARSAIEARLHAAGWGQGVPRAWQFLSIDVPAEPDDPRGAPARLPEHDYLGLVRIGERYAEVYDRVVEHQPRDGSAPERVPWAPEHHEAPMHVGSGQVRAVGRVLALGQAGDISACLRQAWSRMDGVIAREELARVARALGRQVEPAQDPVVYLVTSLAGGTGSAFFLDAAQLARTAAPRATQIAGVLYTSELYASLGAQAAPGIEGNTIAALMELVGQQRGAGGDRSAPMRAGLWVREPLVPALDQTFLIAGVSDQVQLDRPETFAATGRLLADIVTSEPLDGAMMAVRANWTACAVAVADPALRALGSEAGTVSSVGAARVSLGADEFEEYVVTRLSDEIRNVLVATPPRVPLVAESEASSAARWADDLLRPFLHHCGLPRSEDVGLDGLPGEEELQRRVTELGGSVRTQVFRALPIGPAPLPVWAARIVEAAERPLAEAADAAQDQAEALLRDWAADLPRRLHAELAGTAAQFGLLVTERLADAVSEELRDVADERLARAVMPNAEHRMPLLDPLLGALGPDHGAVRALLATVTQAGLRQIDARRDELVADLLRECAEVVVSSARATVTASRQGLQTGTGPSSRGASSTTVIFEGGRPFAVRYASLRQGTEHPDSKIARKGPRTVAVSVMEQLIRLAEVPAWSPKVLGGSATRLDWPGIATETIGTAVRQWLDCDPAPPWLARRTWDDALREGSSTAVVHELRARVLAALDRAAPWVRVNPEAAARVHHVHPNSLVGSFIACPFPAGGLAADVIEEIGHLHPGNVQIAYAAAGDDRGDDIEVLRVLDPVDPAVLSAVFAPLASALAARPGPVWRGRRATSSARGLPVSPDGRRRILRGAAVAAVIGAMAWDAESGGGRITDPAGEVLGVLPNAPFGAPGITGSLSGLPAAWVRFAAGDAAALDGYRYLAELGDLERSTALPQQLEEWMRRWDVAEGIDRLERTAAHFRGLADRPLVRPDLDAIGAPVDLAAEIADAHTVVAEVLRTRL